MIDLERSLVELADRMEIPGGDRLVSDVVRRIGEPVRGRPARRAVSPTRRVVRLAVALVALVALAVVALPGPRGVVARWLGFDSVRIEPGVTVPTTAAPVTTPPTPSPSAGALPTVATTVVEPGLDLGSSMSIVEAMLRTGLPDPTPALLGEPQSIHVVQPPESGQILLVYPPSELLPQSSVTGVGALVSVIPAHIQEGYFSKTLGNTSTVTAVDVNGSAGYWIEGAPHQVLFDIGDQIEPDTLRLATNTLLWQRGDDVYRLEAGISLATALRIAASI